MWQDNNLARRASNMSGSNTIYNSMSANMQRRAEKPQSGRNKRSTLSDEKGTNIQVVLRCRGRNEQEIAANSPVIVEPIPQRRRELLLKTTNKVYSFDRVFGQESNQEQIYNEVAQPILDQVLMGYNCTIFAYGQTGTGKTYTMEGDLQEKNGRYSPRAGIIPRAIYKLFETLDSQKAEYSIKVSLIELYNEELRDLLSTDGGRPLRIFEDQNGSGVIVQGMEESLITSASDALRILQEGSKNRSTAATKCNEKSSRSHCIFTLTVHIKETIPGGEEVLKVGKLNLVDLAGSENISRSGAEHTRAREAGMINQSLLTLGRVINQLVEHSPHVPYRESKLTRLLKDSLGGRTKTCIIATVSAAKMNQEEIISTLDYASRAKNIRNRPEANQRMNPKVLLRDYEITIERLKADLQATREQKGVYLSQQTYDLLTDENQSYKDRINELTRDIDELRESLQERTKELEEKTLLLTGKESELELITSTVRALDSKLEYRIAVFRDSLSEYSRNTEKTIDQLLSSLERNGDIMHALHQEGIRAQNQFADTICKLRDTLRNETEHKKKRAEMEMARFFTAFELDLEDVVQKVRFIHQHYSEAYKGHMQDEEEYLSNNSTSVKNIRSRTLEIVTKEREWADKQYAMLNDFVQVQRSRDKKEAEVMIDTVQSLVINWVESRGKQLEDILGEVQTSMNQNTRGLDTFQSDFESMMSSALVQNTQRSTQVQHAKEQISKHDTSFDMIKEHITQMRNRGEKYREQLLDNLQSGQQLIESISTEIDEADAQRRQQNAGCHVAPDVVKEEVKTEEIEHNRQEVNDITESQDQILARSLQDKTNKPTTAFVDPDLKPGIKRKRPIADTPDLFLAAKKLP